MIRRRKVMVQTHFSDAKVEAYFSHLLSTLPVRKDVHVLAVAHTVPNTVLFLPALSSLVTLSGVLPKPKSVGRPEFRVIKSTYKTLKLSRDWAANADEVVSTLSKLGLRSKLVAILDIGGYFAPSAQKIHSMLGSNFVGILEGTENGVKKYEQCWPNNVRIATVARSPLKLPEDYLVASSVVFSIEAVLRENAEILQTRSAAVVGYGRVGSSVAEILRGRGINTAIFDNDPAKLAEAAARGFQARPNLRDALSAASLVVCATGSQALKLDGFAMLRSGCVVASVTSADDELDLDSLAKGYIRNELSQGITKYEENRPTGRHFFLIAGGNAANFLHGAVIGPAIQLIEGEKLATLSGLINDELGDRDDGPLELDMAGRRNVAEIWNEHFL